jgi:hypothetical protein
MAQVMKNSVETAAERQRQCSTCLGSGEIGTEVGPTDCPDCGGSGMLPHPLVAVEWRMRDIERSHAPGRDDVSADMRWLIAELRRARTALTEIAALAQDAGDSDLVQRLRFSANRALEHYPIADEPTKASASKAIDE